MSAAGNVNIVLSVNKATYTQAMQEAQRQLDTFAGKARGAGHSTVSSMQAASGAIRALENPLGTNIRSLERLASQSKVLSAAFQAAFPLVGAVAGIAIAARFGMELEKAITTAQKMPQVIRDGFAGVASGGMLANDQLRLVNDKLQQEIDKLEHKPSTNGLVLALDEVRVKADELYQSIEKDSKAITELLDKNQVGIVGTLLGQGATASTKGSIESYLQQIKDLAYKATLAAHNGDVAGAAAYSTQVQQKIASGRQWSKQELEAMAGPQESRSGAYEGDQSANIATVQGFDSVLMNMQDKKVIEDQNAAEQEKKAKLDEARSLAQQQKADREKAQREQMQQLEEQHSEFQLAADRSAADEFSFWAQRIVALQKGSTNYIEVQKRMAAAMTTVHRENRTGEDTFDKTTSSIFSKPEDLGVTDHSFLSEQGKTSADYLENLNAGIDLQRRNADAIAESSIQMAVATGQMTRLDAAQALAALHTSQHADALQRLQDALAAVSSDPTLSPTERAERTAGLNNQISDAQGRRAIQAQEDDLAVNPRGSSASVGVRDALDDFVRSVKDTAGTLRSIIGSTLGGLNNAIVKGNGFGDVGRSLFESLAKAGLEKAEGSALSALGFGSSGKMGTITNPMYVKSVDLTGASGGGGLLSSLFGGGNKGDSSDGGGGFASLFQGFFADGGDVTGGRAAIVGERGPEMFIPRSAGTIVPNHRLGGDTHHYEIDARGSHDPAETEAAIHRAMQSYLPHASASSVAAMQEYRKRVPLSRR